MPLELETKVVYIEMPASGLVSYIPGLFIKPPFSPNLDNVRLFSGELRSRPGTVEFPTTRQSLVDTPIGGFGHERPTRDFYSVIGTEQKLYFYDTATSLWDEIQDWIGFPGFTGTVSDPWAIATVLGDAVFSNGVDKVQQWRDPTVDLGNGAGKILEITASFPCRYLAPFANRLILAHVVDSGTVADRVRWSQDNDITNFSHVSSGFVDLVDHPGPITGLAPFGGFLYVFKRDAIIRFAESGFVSPPFTIQKVVDGVGCIEGRTIVDANGKLYFVGRDDIYEWDGASRNPVHIGAQIRDLFFAQLNRARIRQSFAFFNELFNEYCVCIPTGTETDVTESTAWAGLMFVYNVVDRTWTKWSLNNLTCAVPLKSVTTDILTIDDITFPIDSWSTPIDGAFGGADLITIGLGRINVLSTGVGSIYQISENTTSDPTPAAGDQTINVSYESYDVRFGDVGRLRNATLNSVILAAIDTGDDPNITVSISGDSGKSWTFLGSKAVPGSATDAVRYLRFSARFTGTQARVRVSAKGSLKLLRVILEFVERAEPK